MNFRHQGYSLTMANIWGKITGRYAYLGVNWNEGEQIFHMMRVLSDPKLDLVQLAQANTTLTNRNGRDTNPKGGKH